MKKILSSIVLFILLLSLISCAGLSKSEIEGRGFYKSSNNYSLLSIPESSIHLATAAKINSEADINAAIAEKIRKGNENSVALSGDFAGVIYNENAKYYLYVKNPFYSIVQVISPADQIIITGPAIPEKIMARFEGEEQFKPRRIYTKSFIYNEIKMDFGTRILK